MGLINWFRGLLANNDGVEEVRMIEAAGISVDEDMEGWRKITGDANRDLSPMNHKRMQDLALYLWRSNPLANRMIELPIAYLLADGVRLAVKDEEAQGWLDTFWRDPINKMDIKLPKKCRELALYGEQFWPAFVNEANGHVRLGYLDPSLVETVVTDPDNAEQPIGVVTKRDKKGTKRRFRVIVNGPETVFTKRTQEIRQSFEDGEIFYFAINDLSNASRGLSDLLTQLDWLDAYDNAMFGEIERWDFLRAFFYDVELKGATPEEVAKRAREITAPASGSVRVHNDSEKWTAVSPTLGAADGEKIARLFRNHIMGGGTIPEHWFGGGGDVNRATAGEMGEPTFKMFAMRQAFFGYILEEIGTYVIRMRLKTFYGAEPESSNSADDYIVTAVFPELTARDTTKFATAFSQVVVAGAAAIERGLLSEETVIGILSLSAKQLGIEIDPAEELVKARQDKSRREENDAFPGFDDDEKA